MRSTGAEVATRVADIADPEAPADLVEATLEAFGAVDIVIANAGGPPPARALDLDDVQLEAALNANLLSAIRLTREAVPHMGHPVGAAAAHAEGAANRG